MTPLASIKNEVLEQALEGVAINRAQDRMLVNTTPEIDSLAEILIELHDATDPAERRRLAVHGMRLLAQVRELNDTERECERTIAGHAEAIDLDAARERRLTIKRLAAELRPILADLGNPMLGEAGYARRVEALLAVVRQAPPEHLRPECVSLRHELDGNARGARKFTLLHETLDRLGARP